MKLLAKKHGCIYMDLIQDATKAQDYVDQYDQSSKKNKKKKGYLTPDELLAVIKFQELKTGRDAKGVMITLVVTKQDIPKILEKAQLDNPEKIKPEQLLIVLEAWEEMAAQQVEEREKAACCRIL